METKKSPKANLQNWRTVFFEAGLALVMSGMFVAFEWQTSEIEVKNLEAINWNDNLEWDDIPITRAEEPEPPKEIEQPKPQIVFDGELTITDNENDVDDDFDMPDSDVDEFTPIAFVEPEDEAQVEEDVIYVKSEIAPEPEGGELAMRKFLAENVEYPAIAQENEIEGRVFIEFVVNSKGEVCKIKLLKGSDPALDKAALEVVEKMGKAIKWTPGYTQDKAVSVKYTVPIFFTLSKR